MAKKKAKKPVKCEMCGERNAVWGAKNKKVAAGKRKICDKCLDLLPNKGEAIDDYDFIG